MTPKNAAKQPYQMTPAEIAQYRAGVEALIAACLEQIRAYPIGPDADLERERPSQ